MPSPPRPRPPSAPAAPRDASSRRLQRRALLKALAAGVAAPFAWRISRLAIAAPGPRIARLFIMYIPHGMPDEHFDPGPGPALSLVAGGPRILDALAAFQSQVTVVRGIGMNAGATNHAAIRAVLTGFPDATTDSIDYSIAKALGVTAFAIGAVPYAAGSGFTSDSFLVKHGDWVSPTASPSSAADAMLGSLASGGASPGPAPTPSGSASSAPAMPAMPAIDESAFRQEALALTEKELDVLHTQLSGLTSEQTKLSTHLTAVRNLKAALATPSAQGGAIHCSTMPNLPSVAAAKIINPLDQQNFGMLVDAHLEAAAAAIVCNSARVITMQNMWAQADVNFGFAGGPGVAKAHHDPVSHSWDAAGRDEFRRCQRWFFERLAAKFLTALAVSDPSDPSHTVLDNTLVLVLSEVSDGANHNSDASPIWVGGQEQPSYLPCVLMGGAAGYLKPGRVVDVKRTHIDVLATASEAMGVPVSAIGGQAVSAIAELKA